jgi:hypothetical protein
MPLRTKHTDILTTLMVPALLLRLAGDRIKAHQLEVTAGP